MKPLTLSYIPLALLLWLTACNTKQKTTFNTIYQLIEEDNYFRAQQQFEEQQQELATPYQKFLSAVLNNAFNQLEDSEQSIKDLLDQKNVLPDSLLFKLYEIQYDNALKRYRYQEAKEAILTILSNYKTFLDDEDKDDYNNTLKICTALENIPAQSVNIKQFTKINIEKDIAGLNTLKTLVGNDSLNFVFDTGANFSTTTESVARQLNMKPIPVDIKVGSITGDKVSAQLAVCGQLTIGNIDVSNVVFLVLPDKALSFPQINYQIYGILGFPVIEAFKEVRITKNGEFIVPIKTSECAEVPNLAMKGLTPLIYLDHKHFTFDTGADQTILYKRFYEENRHTIDSMYPNETISLGGAGGNKTFDGCNINYSLTVMDTPITLENISLLKEQINHKEMVYGNIGQDLIQKFDTMILNFDQMFICFK